MKLFFSASVLIIVRHRADYVFAPNFYLMCVRTSWNLCRSFLLGNKMGINICLVIFFYTDPPIVLRVCGATSKLGLSFIPEASCCIINSQYPNDDLCRPFGYIHTDYFEGLSVANRTVRKCWLKRFFATNFICNEILLAVGQEQI